MGENICTPVNLVVDAHGYEYNLEDEYNVSTCVIVVGRQQDRRVPVCVHCVRICVQIQQCAADLHVATLRRQ